jgi:hypothetical protein
MSLMDFVRDALDAGDGESNTQVIERLATMKREADVAEFTKVIESSEDEIFLRHAERYDDGTTTSKVARRARAIQKDAIAKALLEIGMEKREAENTEALVAICKRGIASGTGLPARSYLHEQMNKRAAGMFPDAPSQDSAFAKFCSTPDGAVMLQACLLAQEDGSSSADVRPIVKDAGGIVRRPHEAPKYAKVRAAGDGVLSGGQPVRAEGGRDAFNINSPEVVEVMSAKPFLTPAQAVAEAEGRRRAVERANARGGAYGRRQTLERVGTP